MARIRTIKPEFWKNEVLGEMPAEFALLFIGLWNLADRRGFLEDRPKRIKAELFPYRHVDIENGLEILCNGFIRRLLVDDIPYIQILNFQKHQHINMKESESTVPTPYWHHASIVLAPDQHAGVWSKEGKGMDIGKGGGREASFENFIPPPPFPEIISSNNLLMSYEDTKKEFLASNTWHEQICMDLNIDLPFLLSDMDSFLVDLNKQDQFPRKLSDSKSFYYRRLVKFLKNNNKNTSKTLDYELGKSKKAKQ